MQQFQHEEYTVFDWFTLVLLVALLSFVGGILTFAWLMMKVIHD